MVNWSVKRIAGIAMAVVLALLLSAGGAAASVIIHQGVENFYDSGGTVFTPLDGCVIACEPFSVGDTNGEIIWELTEKVHYDLHGDNTTTYVYTVQNDQIQFGITSLHVATGRGGFDQTSPDNWVGTIDETGWHWSTEGTGVVQPFALNTFSVTLRGHDNVTFTNVGIDILNGAVVAGFGCTEQTEECLRYPNWLGSGPGVPEPGTLLLLGTGLVGLGLAARRRGR